MNRTRSVVAAAFVLTAVVADLTAVAPAARAQQQVDLPIPCEGVAEKLSVDNLRAVASRTNDAQVLLGLAYLAPTGGATGKDLGDLAVRGKADYAPIVAVLTATTQGGTEPAVAELIGRDADNALGHYLRATLLFKADRDEEALDAYRKAAGCPEMRLYEPVTSAALFKALDALELKGRERLCALSWVATRASNFGILAIQPLPGDLMEIARLQAGDRREEISDLLLILAGHLSDTNFNNRMYAARAVEAAFRLKAEVAAAENSPKMNGYAAVTQALVSTTNSSLRRDVAWFLPSRVYGAFRQAQELAPANQPGADAKAAEAKAAQALIELAAADPDGTVGAYLKGLPPHTTETKTPWESRITYVEDLMGRSPQLFTAAAAYEKAMDDAQAVAAKDDPSSKNFLRMRKLYNTVASYAFQHDDTFPPSIQALTDEKVLDPGVELRSVVTGRPYVFAAAGKKLPAKQRDVGDFIVLYDDHDIDGQYQCVLADGHGEHIPVGEVEKRLKAKRK